MRVESRSPKETNSSLVQSDSSLSEPILVSKLSSSSKSPAPKQSNTFQSWHSTIMVCKNPVPPSPSKSYHLYSVKSNICSMDFYYWTDIPYALDQTSRQLCTSAQGVSDAVSYDIISQSMNQARGGHMEPACSNDKESIQHKSCHAWLEMSKAAPGP